MKLSLPELLAQHRQREQLSKELAAEKIGISVRQYSRWAAGQSKPSREGLKKIAAALQLDLDELSPPPPKQTTTTDRLEHIETKLDRVIKHLGC